MIRSAGLGIIDQDLQKVEQALLSVSPPEQPELGAIVTELIRSGGKRLRPALVLLAARFNDYRIERLVDGAVAIELLHTATLVHDDTIDRASVRRGHATVNSYLPDKAAILIGDYIFAQSAIYASKPRDPEVVSVFARTLRDICDGELRQMLGNHQLRCDRQEYFARIYAKTGALFACATEIGALLSGASDTQRETLRRIGERLGQAFQVVDDILDFTATTTQAGKPVGNDLLHGTVTLPTIIYLEQVSATHGRTEEVMRALRSENPEDAARAVAAVRDSSALDLAYAEAQRLADEATAMLLDLPSGDARNALFDLAQYVVRRDR